MVWELPPDESSSPVAPGLLAHGGFLPERNAASDTFYLFGPGMEDCLETIAMRRR